MIVRLTLLILLLWPTLCRAESEWNHAHDFLQGRAALIAGETKQARKIFDRLKNVKALQTWCKYYLAEATLLDGNFSTANKLYSQIKSDGVPNLAKQLAIEQLRLQQGARISNQTLDQLKANAELVRLDEVSAQFLLLKGMSYLSRGELMLGMQSLLELDQNYPKTVARKKSGIFRTRWLKSKASLAPEIRLMHSRLLGSEKEYNLAFEWLKGVALEYGAANREKEAEAALSWELDLLTAANKPKELTDLFSTLSSEQSRYREFGVTELARRSWQKNDYQRAKETLNQLPASSPFRSYLLGRIAEEHSDYALSRTYYQKALSQGEFSDKFHAAFRLGLLQFADHKFKHAAEDFKASIDILGEKDSADYQAAYFWRNQSLRKANLKLDNDPQPYDLRSVYFWLEKGARYDSPQAAASRNILPVINLKSCPEAKASVVPERERIDWGALSRIGLSNYLGAEIRLANPGNDLEAKFKRIALYDYFGAHAEKFREFWERTTFAEAYERCPKETLQALYPLPYFEIFQSLATHFSLQPQLVLAFSRTESAFNPLAVSRSGAMGLMQLMPKTAAELGFTPQPWEREPPLTAFLPPTNVQLGASYVRKMLDRFSGKWFQAVAAYNAGPEAVDRWVSRYPGLPAEVWAELIPYKETREYVKRVMAAYWIYAALSKGGVTQPN